MPLILLIGVFYARHSKKTDIPSRMLPGIVGCSEKWRKGQIRLQLGRGTTDLPIYLPALASPLIPTTKHSGIGARALRDLTVQPRAGGWRGRGATLLHLGP